MRRYLTVGNLMKSLPLAAVAACLASPRIIQTPGVSPWLMAVVFPVLVMLSGAVMAWGESAGMNPFPARAILARGIATALAAAALLTPLELLLDQPLRLAAAADPDVANVARLPESFRECVVLAMWTAGFEIVFFQGASMSYLGRLTGSRFAAIAGAVILRAAVTFLKFNEAGIDVTLWPAMVGAVAASIAACIIYSRSGLLSAMLFGAALSMRHLAAI